MAPPYNSSQIGGMPPGQSSPFNLSPDITSSENATSDVTDRDQLNGESNNSLSNTEGSSSPKKRLRRSRRSNWQNPYRATTSSQEPTQDPTQTLSSTSNDSPTVSLRDIPGTLSSIYWRRGVSSWRAYSTAQIDTSAAANNGPVVDPNVSRPSLSRLGIEGRQNSMSPQPRLGNPHGTCPVLGGRGWPRGKIPPEIFEHIGSILSRNDLLRMRLVNHEFEFNISSRVFQSVVVPFEPDIYGMTNTNTGKISLKSDSRETQHQRKEYSVRCLPVSDGVGTFRSWGQKIKKFAIAFDLDEDSFFKLPAKSYYDEQISFYGRYKWPRPGYSRYKSCEDREKKADETRCMTLAFSHLTNLNEFGLVVDSGLGWIQGPDCSDRVQIMREKQKIFGSKYSIPNDKACSNESTWRNVVLAKNQIRNRARTRPDLATPRSQPIGYDFEAGQPYTFETVCENHALYEGMPNVRWAEVPVQDFHPPLVFRGLEVELGTRDHTLCQASYPSDAMIPNDLKYSQLEWLIENEWAQQAFLTSFTVSVMDNPSNFRQLRTLNIANLSSRYIPAISNQSFWSALPNLQTLKMFVSPDWRDIAKDPNEVVQAPTIRPSSAGTQFYDFLEACIAHAKKISVLDIGWLGGGERATGLFARNQHVLPAPVLRFSKLESVHLPCKTLELPSVKHLTLSNCWFHPGALKVFVRRMERAELQTLKLNSVSLTAMPGKTASAGLQAANPQIHINVPAQNLYNPALAAVPNVQGQNLPNAFYAPPLHFPIQPNPQAQPNLAGAAFQNYMQGQHPNMTYFDLPPANAGSGRPQNILAALNEFHPYLHMSLHGRRIADGTAPPGSHLPYNGFVHSYPTIESLNNQHRIGSWGEVIDKITPGKTIDHQRHLHNKDVRYSEPRKSTPFRSIEFVSCGYVRLTNHQMNQDTIPDIMRKPPLCLKHRKQVLSDIMMKDDHDPLLGTIVPVMPNDESDILQVAFGMRMGWERDDMSKYEPREDGQPVGGSGRFSGAVTRDS